MCNLVSNGVIMMITPFIFSSCECDTTNSAFQVAILTYTSITAIHVAGDGCKTVANAI